MPDTATRWSSRSFEAVFGAAYDFGVEHPWVSGPVGAALMGTDIRRFYLSLDAVGAMPDGAAVLDVPAGGGVALRGLRPEQRLRYVAADISATMLDRVRRRVRRRGLSGIDLVEADIEHLPFADGEFDLCLCFNGLHCLPRPAAAVRELARCLRPGGRLLGDCILRGELARTDVWVRAMRAAGVFGEPGTHDDLRRWLDDAGLRVQSAERSGAICHFEAVRQ